MSDEYMTFEQASQYLNTPRSTLYRWLKEGKVPGHKLGRQWRFLRSELERWRTQPPPVGGEDPDDPLRDLRRVLRERAVQPTQEAEMMTALTTRDMLLWTAYDEGATALHLQPEVSGGWRLLQRTGGRLQALSELAPEAALALAGALEETMPESMRDKAGVRSAFKMQRGRDQMLVLHQHLPTALGPRWTLRLIRERPGTRELSELMDHPDQEVLERLLSSSHGLLLISGTSGSGKTSTAHACLRRLEQGGAGAIFTLEPSTEHLIPGVNQVNVDLDDERAYRRAFACVMNSDPDVLFISSTFAPRHRGLLYTTALNAAESGHLVLVQLEAESAGHAIERFQAHVERAVDDCVVGAVWQTLEPAEDGALRARYELLEGPLSVV